MKPEAGNDSVPKTLPDWLAYQESLHAKPIDLGLDRLRGVAVRLGLPAARTRTITVGGTNGKGSTTTLLAGIYRAAGYAVGAYTSPHLFHYSERIAINGVPVDDEALCEAFAAVERARGEVTITYFEFGTLAALWLFARAQLDVQILEVGLGGRLDAVNLVDADAAIVTNIGLDHQDYLGNTLDAIGTEKAGIFRAGRPAILAGTQHCEGLLASAQNIGAKLIRRELGDFTTAVRSEGWDWHGGDTLIANLPLPALPGAHQIDNAAGAIAAIQQMQAVLPVSGSAIRKALNALTLPARMQWRGRVLLDVAHNAEAAVALASYLRGTLPPGEKIIWIAGMLADKPVEAIAAALAPLVAEAQVFSLPPPRGLRAEQFAARIATAGVKVQSHDTAEQALMTATAHASENQRIVVCGSFFTVAAIAPLLPAEPA